MIYYNGKLVPDTYFVDEYTTNDIEFTKQFGQTLFSL